MSILGLMENTADIAQTTPTLSALPSTNAERAAAAWDAAQSPDRYWNVDSARAARADKIIDDLHAMTGERLLNPFGIGNTPTTDEIRENVGQPMAVIYAKRMEKLRTATRNAKAGMEQLGGLPQDYLDVDSIDPSIASEAGGRRARDERMSGTGGGFGGFVGAMAGETVSPHGIATSFIPVTRMGGAVAEAGVAAFARNVAKEAAFQGGAQALAQSMATVVDYQTRKQFGTEQTNAQILEEIISAAGGGAILGGAFRGIHLGILKLASRGVEIPPAVLDRARMMEEGDLYGDKNPLRINPGQAEVATDQATSAAALGRAASPNVDVDAGIPTLHDAARRLNPELMQRYDAAVAWREEARATLAPDDATIARLKERADAADAAIANAGGATQEVAERLGASARMAHLVHDDAVARKAAMEAGGAVEETTVSQSMRQQAQMADLELRELIPEINKLMTRAGEEVTAATRSVEEARAAADRFLAEGKAAEEGAAISRLSPEEVSRVRELQEQIPEYERMRDAAASPEDRTAWQQAIDDFHTEIAKIMDLDIADQAPVKAAMARLEAVPTNPMQAPRPAPPEPKAQPATPKAAGESAEDKAVLHQAKGLLDNETIAKIDPEARGKLEDLDIKEREYQAAVSCVVGAI